MGQKRTVYGRSRIHLAVTRQAGARPAGTRLRPEGSSFRLRRSRVMGRGHGKGVKAAHITAAPEAAASYNDLVLSDADLAGRTHEELMRAHHDNGLMIRDRPLCSVLRPRF